MAEIVQLSDYKTLSALKAGSRLWRRRFGEPLDVNTRLNDLTPGVLSELADGTDDVTALYYSMILGFMGHDAAADFDSLENRLKILVVDIHLFLMDQVRFEMMRRLGWLARFSATQYPLFELVRQFDQIKIIFSQDPPLLAEDHSGYNEYKVLVPHDQQVFIRRLFPSALDSFKKKYSC